MFLLISCTGCVVKERSFTNNFNWPRLISTFIFVGHWHVLYSILIKYNDSMWDETIWWFPILLSKIVKRRSRGLCAREIKGNYSCPRCSGLNLHVMRTVRLFQQELGTMSASTVACLRMIIVFSDLLWEQSTSVRYYAFLYFPTLFRVERTRWPIKRENNILYILYQAGRVTI